MSYLGYNLSSYQYQAGRATQTPSNSFPARQPVSNAPSTAAAASTSAWQQTDRDYSQQDYRWQTNDSSSIHAANTSQAGNSYWSSSNNHTQSHAQDPSQQHNYRSSQLGHSATTQSSLNQSRMTVDSSPAHASYNTTRVASNTAPSRAHSSASTNLYYSQTMQPKNRTASPNITLDPTDRPDSAQRSRNAAVSLTALSSGVPSRQYSASTTAASSVAYSPQTLTYIPTSSKTTSTNNASLTAYSSGYGLAAQSTSRQPSNKPQPSAIHIGQGRDTWSSLSTNSTAYTNSSTQLSTITIPRNTTPQARTSQPVATTMAPGYGSMRSTSSAVSGSAYATSTAADSTGSESNPAPMDNNTHRYSSTQSHSQSTASSNVPQRNNPPAPRRDMAPPESPAPTSLPTFVDPSKIYDPYYDYERVKATHNAHNTDTVQSARSTPAESDQSTAVEQALVAALGPNTEQQTTNEHTTGDSQRTSEVLVQQEAEAPQSPRNPKKPRTFLNPSNSRNYDKADNPGYSYFPSNPDQPSSKRKSGGPRASKGKGDSSQAKPEDSPPKKRGRPPRKPPVNQDAPVAEQTDPVPVEFNPLAPAADIPETPSMETSMASEMRSMIEKMREWRSKDPSLFAKLWEDVKKTPSSANSQTPAASQPSPAKPPTPAEKADAGATSTAQQSEKPSEKQSEESSNAIAAEKKLPDLGRFPAQRRKRKPRQSKTVVVDEENEKEKEKKPKAVKPRTEGKSASQSRAEMSIGRLTKAMNTIFEPIVVDEDESAPPPREETPVQETQLPSTENGISQGEPRPTTNVVNGELKEPAVVDLDAKPAEAQPPPKAPEQKPSSIWPLAKRQWLAEAACDYIKGIERNFGKDCPPSLILSLIDQDPSYTQLCEMIEGKGLSINRVYFAKHLLKTIPDLGSKGSPSPAPPQVSKGPLRAPQPVPRPPPGIIPTGPRHLAPRLPDMKPPQPPPVDTPQVHATKTLAPTRIPPTRPEESSQPAAPPETGPSQTAEDFSPGPDFDEAPPASTPQTTTTIGYTLPASIAKLQHLPRQSLPSSSQLPLPRGTATPPGPSKHSAVPFRPPSFAQSAPNKTLPSPFASRLFPPIPPVPKLTPLPVRRQSTDSQTATPPPAPPRSTVSQPTLPAPVDRQPSATAPAPPGPPIAGQWALPQPGNQQPSGPSPAQMITFKLPMTPLPQDRYRIQQTAPYAGPSRPPYAQFLAPPPMNHPIPARQPPPVVQRPPVREPPPGSKEALAKKRSFSDIVDLTQGLDDDDEDEDMVDAQPASKVPRLNDTASVPLSNVDVPKVVQVDAAEQRLHKALCFSSEIVKPINKAEALRKSYYNPKTIARDILIASGRHPTERPLNNHLVKLRENFIKVDFTSDLHTFRWDLVDPGSPPPEVPLAPLPRRPSIPSRPVITELNSDTSSSELPISEPRALEGPRRTRRASNSIDHNEKHNHHQDVERVPTPDSPRSENEPAFRYSDFMKPYSSLSKKPQKMARPAPLPRLMRSPPSSVTKPKTKLGSNVEVVVRNTSRTSPLYREYNCRWKGCDAKLHNLDTLRKHVARLHVPQSGHRTPCRWLGCEVYDNEASSSRRQSQQGRFSSTELHDHLEEAHLNPIAWKYGEGPATKGSVPQVERTAHMLDQDGRSLTPKISERGPKPALIFPAASSSIRSFNKIYGNRTAHARAMEVLRALETKQARVGIGVGKGGCTLFNRERRKTVAAFKKLRRIVSADDESESD